MKYVKLSARNVGGVTPLFIVLTYVLFISILIGIIALIIFIICKLVQ
ncbi:MAG: hypothetical protein U0L76_04420 [Ruminococcus sp.]|nr:hypothetical protein [Ruminococcus sp.]